MKYPLLFVALLLLAPTAQAQHFLPGDSVLVMRGVSLRNGPGLGANEIGERLPGDTLVLLETRSIEGSEYGRIDSTSWVLLSLDLKPMKLVRQEEEFVRGLIHRDIPIVVEGIGFDVNSAGGVEPRLRFLNISDKRIKYLHVDIVPYNAVGDPVQNAVGGKAAMNLRLVGPVDPSEPVSFDFAGDPPFYNGTTRCLELHRIEVEFMEGGRFVLLNDLRHARRPGTRVSLKGDCAVQ